MGGEVFYKEEPQAKQKRKGQGVVICKKKDQSTVKTPFLVEEMDDSQTDDRREMIRRERQTMIADRRQMDNGHRYLDNTDRQVDRQEDTQQRQTNRYRFR